MTLDGRSILITGGTGSFANAFVKKVLPLKFKRLVLFSRDEQKQDAMAKLFEDDRLRFFVGDVRDRQRLEMAMYGIDLVLHTAALKIVPSCEYNPFEAVMTNVIGSENVCRAAIAAGVRKVIALSTDKAVSPLNLYGATKLCAEKIFVASNSLAAGRCLFSICRYGNVLNSRGSVTTVFKALRDQGKPLCITDPRMTRFWMTLDQAVEFVLSCDAMMHGREIYLPKIPSVFITHVAQAIDPKFNPQDMKVIGIRPGEKLHECLMTEDESRSALESWDRFVIGPDVISNIKKPFNYTSDANEKWLNIEAIRRLL
jgi:UDP-N-acetylglucosamine 4,6-dehydratase